MTIHVGGTRSRLISDNFYKMVVGSLEKRGWFDPDQQHAPIALVRGEISWDVTIAPNTLAISDVDITDADVEMGSNLKSDTWTSYVDFYAESDSLGTDVAGDVRDILRGKIRSVGRTAPILEVFDLTVNPDIELAPKIFYCDIENVLLDRAHNASRPYMEHWFSVRCDIVDTYGDEDDE